MILRTSNQSPCIFKRCLLFLQYNIVTSILKIDLYVVFIYFTKFTTFNNHSFIHAAPTNQNQKHVQSDQYQMKRNFDFFDRSGCAKLQLVIIILAYHGGANYTLALYSFILCTLSLVQTPHEIHFWETLGYDIKIKS